jgi:hypothetical protein
MKRRLLQLILPVTLLGAACSAPKDQSIIVTQARAPGLACDFSDPTKYVESGQIDLAAFGAASSFIQIFGWENDLQDIGVNVNGSQITTETPNTFIATAIQDTYVMVGGTSPPSGFVNISATIAPGGVPATSDVGVYLLTQEAAQTICGNPTATENCPGLAAGSPSATLLVTFQIMGTLVGGGQAQTNPITFPLTLFNSGNTVPSDPAVPTLEPWVCKVGGPQVDSCGIPGRSLPYCPGT